MISGNKAIVEFLETRCNRHQLDVRSKLLFSFGVYLYPYPSSLENRDLENGNSLHLLDYLEKLHKYYYTSYSADVKLPAYLLERTST